MRVKSVYENHKKIKQEQWIVWGRLHREYGHGIRPRYCMRCILKWFFIWNSNLTRHPVFISFCLNLATLRRGRGKVDVRDGRQRLWSSIWSLLPGSGAVLIVIWSISLPFVVSVALKENIAVLVNVRERNNGWDKNQTNNNPFVFLSFLLTGVQTQSLSPHFTKLLTSQELNLS